MQTPRIHVQVRNSLKSMILTALVACVFLIPALAAAQTKTYVGLSTLNSRVTPLWIAQEKGFFAKNGIEALLVLTRLSNPAIAALLAGELQIVYGGANAALGAASNGAELKAHRGHVESIDLRVDRPPRHQ